MKQICLSRLCQNKGFLFPTVAILLLTSSHVHPNESWTPTDNSIEIRVDIFSGRTNPFYYETDSSQVAIIKSMITAVRKRPSPQQMVLPSNPGYSGLFIGVWDNRYYYSYVFNIYDGLTLDDSTKTYVDSNRSLERYLLCLASRSKIVDTLLGHVPLSTYVPDSLFSGCTGMGVITPLTNSRYPILAATALRGIFNLLGKRISVAIPFRDNGQVSSHTQYVTYIVGLTGRHDCGSGIILCPYRTSR